MKKMGAFASFVTPGDNLQPNAAPDDHHTAGGE